MKCTCEIPAWPAAPPARGVVFSPRQSYAGARSIGLPCGRCIGCRLTRASEWATRISHEAALHEYNSFLTLTYSNEYLPSNLSVSVLDLQLFLKRLRKQLEPLKIRFVACGEYGTINQRPHYHLIIFGHAFQRDRVPWRKSPTGHVLYRSASLEKVWPYGNSEIGTVTPQSGAYVARYTLKKVFGDEAESAPQYQRERFNPETGEIERWSVAREFFLSSRRPGIGAAWMRRYHADAFNTGFVVLGGTPRRVPAFYVRKLQEEAPLDALRFTSKRRAAAIERAEQAQEAPSLLERHEFNRLTTERFERDPERE